MAKSKVKTEKSETIAAEKAQKVTEAKSPKSKVDSVKKTPMKAKAKAAGDAKPAKKKPTHPVTSEMVAHAFTVLKNRKGLTLAAIRKHIGEEYKCEVTKTIQTHIKKYITGEFEAGRIKMVGHDGDDIKFNQRFALVK